jgi:hypothetical protein
MVLLFTDQLRDEPALRIWARGAIDFAITVPALHLETRMKRPSNTATPLAFAALGLGGVLLAIVGGSSLGMVALGLSVAAASGALSVVAWRRSRTLTTALPVTAHWWKLLAGGAGVLAAVIVATTITGEITNGLWWPIMITIALSVTTLGAGLVLGVAHLTGHRTHPPPAERPPPRRRRELPHDRARETPCIAPLRQPTMSRHYSPSASSPPVAAAQHQPAIARSAAP